MNAANLSLMKMSASRPLSLFSNTAPFRAPKGIDAEMLRREMAKCDHGAFLAAQDELTKLRREAAALIVPFLKR